MTNRQAARRTSRRRHHNRRPVATVSLEIQGQPRFWNRNLAPIVAISAGGSIWALVLLVHSA